MYISALYNAPKVMPKTYNGCQKLQSMQQKPDCVSFSCRNKYTLSKAAKTYIAENPKDELSSLMNNLEKSSLVPDTSIIYILTEKIISRVANKDTCPSDFKQKQLASILIEMLSLEKPYKIRQYADPDEDPISPTEIIVNSLVYNCLSENIKEFNTISADFTVDVLTGALKTKDKKENADIIKKALNEYCSQPFPYAKEERIADLRKLISQL